MEAKLTGPKTCAVCGGNFRRTQFAYVEGKLVHYGACEAAALSEVQTNLLADIRRLKREIRLLKRLASPAGGGADGAGE